MNKLTLKQKQKMDRAIKYAPLRQVFMWVWWEFFYPKKAATLINRVEAGMSWNAAYTIAKNL